MNMKSGIRRVRGKGLLVALVPTIALGGLSVPTYADNAGWFLGGVATTRILGDMRRRSLAAERQAAATEQMSRETAARPVILAPTVAAAPAAAPAASGSASIEAKLNTLDTLLAKGYITKQQYDARKNAILDSI